MPIFKDCFQWIDTSILIQYSRFPECWKSTSINSTQHRLHSPSAWATSATEWFRRIVEEKIVARGEKDHSWYRRCQHSIKNRYWHSLFPWLPLPSSRNTKGVHRVRFAALSYWPDNETQACAAVFRSSQSAFSVSGLGWTIISRFSIECIDSVFQLTDITLPRYGQSWLRRML